MQRILQQSGATAGSKVTLNVFFYCPDRHLLYDGTTPDRKGVGGGVTARIRLATALARLGHRVTMACNCPRARRYRGVDYVPLDTVRAIETNVLVAHSSGGALDLTSLHSLPLNADLRVLLVSGVVMPKNANPLGFDAVYAPSNFIRKVVRTKWCVPGEKIFVSHRGVRYWPAQRWFRPRRRPHRLIYPSHPSKGLLPAIGILRLLRADDPDFELHVYSGDELWGGEPSQLAPEPGLFYGGLVGQRRLAQLYSRCSIALQLQPGPDAFGMTVVEAMAAGCIVLASLVGSYPEIIRHGENGFLIGKDLDGPEAQQLAVHLIRDLTKEPDFANQIRRKAEATPLDWRIVARTWEGHWKWLANGKRTGMILEAGWRCPHCRGAYLILADGYHCVGCGYYSREIQVRD